MNATWECIVVGGGAAGLSAALVLGRARRRTLVIDAGAPSNRVSHGIGGLLGHDTTPPATFYAEARANLAAYPTVELRSGTVVDVERRSPTAGDPGRDGGGSRDATGGGAGDDGRAGGRDGGAEDGGFVLTVADGSRETARTVVLASGMDYALPDVPGLDPLWGGSVFHCPFCHGWEHAGQPLGVLDRGESGVHRATLLRAWSDDVTLLTDGPDALDDAHRAELSDRGIAVDERRVAGLEADTDDRGDRAPEAGRGDSGGERASVGGDREDVGSGTEDVGSGRVGRGTDSPPAPALAAVRFADGSARPLRGLLIPITLHQRAGLAQRLGLDVAPETPISTETVAVDPFGATSVPGVFSAGDASSGMPSVANAIAAGSNAAAGVVQRLMFG